MPQAWSKLHGLANVWHFDLLACTTSEFQVEAHVPSEGRKYLKEPTHARHPPTTSKGKFLATVPLEV